MTRILFNITHGFQARMLLRSVTSETLLERGAELVVVSRNSSEPYFRQEFKHPRITLEDMPFRATRVEAHSITLRQYLLMNPALGKTLNFKNEAFRRQAPRRYWLARSGNAVLGRFAPLRRAYMAMEAKLFAGREFDALLERHKPDLVVTGTPGYGPEDIHLLRAAHRLQIPTATVMLSWDNLTSKGYMGAVPDHLLVWSDLMAEEAVQYHDYPRDHIHWCGAAQFDHYHGIRERLDRASWRREHGVSPDASLVVYGTINPAILPHEPEIVREIADAVRRGRFARPTHLWIRLHPQVVRGQYSKSLTPYRQLAGPNVTVEEPRVQSEALAWDLPKEDTMHLANLLTAADVVATPGSTIMIESACVGTPAINVLFDGPQPVEAAVSTHRFLNYEHQAKVLTTGGIARAMSLEEFVRLTDAYCANPQIDAEGRERVIRQQLNRLDGRAGFRTAETLLKLARGDAPPSRSGSPHAARPVASELH